MSALVRDADGRLLLVQQADSGFWSTPGGALDLDDESPADAIVREVWEETGLFVVPTRVVAVHGGPDNLVRYPNGDETQYVSTVFECEVQSGELRADGDEISVAKYWTQDEALRLPLIPWLTKVLPRFYHPSAGAWFAPPTWRPLDV